VSVLDHKAWHDLGRMRGQSVAIAALVACAMAAWVSTALTERAMRRTRDVYYAEQRFGDVFAAVRRAPETVASRVAALPGVAEVETRIVFHGRIELPGGGSARAVFVSVPDRSAPRLNGLTLRDGRALLPDERGAVLVTEGFASANRLRPGSTLAAVLNGRRERVRVAGVALSPEFVYAIGPGMIFPDDRSFGVVWMARADVGAAAGLEGAFNALVVRLAPGAVEAEVIAAIDRALEPWGGTGAHGRDDQISNRYLGDELMQLRAMAVVVPSIFLGVGAFLLSVIASRLVGAQRQQIGMLKALGYPDLAVALHYAKLVGAVVGVGTLAGAAGGLWLGGALARMYAGFFRFPFLVYSDAPGVLAAGAGLSGLAALAGVAGAVRRAARLPPAEAMRPEPPAEFGGTWLERLPPARWIPPAWSMVLRNLARRPVRAATSALGLAAAVAVIVVAGALGDALRHLLRLNFEVARREDAIVVFSEASGRDAVVELRSLPGVRAVEPFRSAAVTLRHGTRTYRTELAGLEPGSVLWRLVDVRGQVVPVPPSGVVLSSQLARILDVAVGEDVRVVVHEGRRPAFSLPVVALVDDFVGVSATASLGLLDARLGDGPLASGATVALAPGGAAAFAARAAERPRVAGVTLGDAFRAAMEDVVWRFLDGVVAALSGFAFILAAGVVYNAARIAHAERARELATLQVLGFTEGEVWRILAGELGALVVAAVPLGCAMGVAFVALATRAMSSDLFRLTVVISPGTWLRAVATVGIAGAGLVALARGWVARVDLVEVLKARE
jgi:putative ABC transport system permease protein